jgi:rhodanese-related sulfurtransferase
LLLAGCEALPPPIPPPPVVAAYEPPRVTIDELKARRAANEDMLIVDVRSAEVFGIEHAAGAVNVPWKDLPSGYAQLPKDRLLLLYCT